MDVVDERITHTFTVRTDVTWAKFGSDVCQYFNRSRDEVILGYRVSGDRRKFLLLTCEADWMVALRCVKLKIMAARKHAVTIEVKNIMVSGVSIDRENGNLHVYSAGADGTGRQEGEGERKGKGKAFT